MALIETELANVKKEIYKMFVLIQSQLEDSGNAILKNELLVAKSIKDNEELVNDYEIKIDSLCENLLARFTPVAADLRFVLSILKINSCLERIGDAAKGIANFVIKNDYNNYKNYFVITKCDEIYEYALKILGLTLQAFEAEDIILARTIFKLNKVLDELCTEARVSISRHIEKNPSDAENAINYLSALRKLSRVGDQATNISEEIIFYIEAKNIKHTKQI